MRGVILVLVVSMALIALAGSCSSQSSKASAPPAPNLHGKIVLIREGKYNGEVTVFTAAANGTHVRQLSDFGEAPRFSPDGTEVMMAGPAPEGQRIKAGIVHSGRAPFQTLPPREPSLSPGVGGWA